MGDTLSFEDISRWLPYPADPCALEDSLGNKSLYPSMLAETPDSLLIEQAILREVLKKQHVGTSFGQKSKEAGGEVGYVIPEEITALSSTIGQSVLLFLDSFQPTGIISLSMRVDGETKKVASVVCFEGTFLKQTLAAEINFDFGLSQKQKINALTEEILVVPAKTDQSVKLDISCKALKIFGKDRLTIEVRAGILGIIIDTRGRPLVLPSETGACRAKVKSWQKAFEGLE